MSDSQCTDPNGKLEDNKKYSCDDCAKIAFFVTKSVILALLIVLLAVLLLIFHDRITPVEVKETVAYVLSFLFGASVGAAELVSRYKDKPGSALATFPSFIYVIVNAMASLVAFWLLYTNRISFNVHIFGNSPALNDLLLGGFGAMALFRTAVFNVRIGDNTVGVGPAAVLQVILRVTDRETDRLRAGPRAERVGEIMRGVVYERARDTLALHCYSLMQNITLDEQNNLEQALAVLDRRQSMGDEAKRLTQNGHATKICVSSTA